ncbi:MAG: hypothetical protein MRERV_16c003 [Mycoplasmataceae bacterium RV_VA103A]|nr:MAG: hypothetical protein MRERV_16c003 [Mycoplasmataceae bacterium RV_VA103A]
MNQEHVEDNQETQLNRNWQSFYNWLEKNIVDREAGGSGKGNIKEEKRGEYPEIVSQYHSFVVLMISLEKTIGIPIKTHNNLNQSEIVKMEEYREGKSFAELRKNWEKGYFKPGVYPELDAEFEKLFREWKKDTIV